MTQQYLKVIDIGHSGKSPEDALSILAATVSQCAYGNKIKAIKVITGHGSGRLREIVREWCKDQEGRFKEVINGEDYDMFNKSAVHMRDECSQPDDNDFGRNNSAITYIWLR